jgi:IS30 family transposase
MLVRIPGRETLEEVTAALASKVQDLPVELFRSLTRDRGLEMSEHAQFTSMASYTQADLDEVAARLNSRPRQTLGFMTPCQVLAQALR